MPPDDSAGPDPSTDPPPAGRPTFNRDAALARLAEETFDILVIGGGITGAGVALDAASRGLRTALVEKDDFASGTSSKSSKLVHGGLRYLQSHEFRLVYENLAERQRLLENASHLVSPVPFLIPLFGRDGVVNRGVARFYRTALWAYDLTGGVRIGRRHERVDRSQALAHLPTLKADGLVAGFLYWDARTDDARLTLTVLRTAVLDHGAVAANHTRVVAVTRGTDGRVNGARLDLDDGDPFEVRAKVVVNAGGVWADEIDSLDGRGGQHSIRPAKGIHVTVPQAAFPCDIAAVIPVRGDHRSIFVVSWGEQVYLGTTDTEWDGPLDDPGCSPEDIDYLLGAANAFTTQRLERHHITGLWAGLRPLLSPGEGGDIPRQRTADLSRRHTVRLSDTGLVTVTGGKLTTYRKMAEDTVDMATKALGRRSLRSVTKTLPLRGNPRARPKTTRFAAPHPPGAPGGVDEGAGDRAGAVAAHLASRFGTEAGAVLDLADNHTGLLEPLVPGLGYLRAEALYAVRYEMATSLADILERRTRAVFRDARAAAAAAVEVAALVGPDLGWSPEQCADEAREYAAGILGSLTKAGLPTPASFPQPENPASPRNGTQTGTKRSRQ